MIHVVFNESEVDLMRTVMEHDETLKGEVMLIRDDFAVGPLAAIDTDAGWQARLDWWKEISIGSPYVNAPALFHAAVPELPGPGDGTLYEQRSFYQ